MSTSTERPKFCPTCGKGIGMLAVTVRLGKQPWTCEDCDGMTPEQLSRHREKKAGTRAPSGTVAVERDDLRLVLDEPCVEGSMSRPDSYFEAKIRLQAALADKEG